MTRSYCRRSPSVNATSTWSSEGSISVKVTPVRTSAPDASVRDVRISCSFGRVRPLPGGSPSTSGGQSCAAMGVCAVGEPRAVTPDRSAGLDAGVGEAQRVECAQSVPRLDDPDAVHAPPWIAFDDVDLEALAAERQRGGESADAATDDKNLHPLDLTSTKISDSEY